MSTPEVPADADNLFRSLVEQSLGLMCVHDLEGNLVFVNKAAADALGFAPEEGIGLNLRRFLSPLVASEFENYLTRIRTRGVDSGLMMVVSKSGAERIWLYRNILDQPAGAPPRVLGHAQDVTERIRAEQALRESERRFRRLADTASILIWMSDDSGACIFVNQPWVEFTGRPAEEHLGEGWTHYIHPDDRSRVVDAYWTAVSTRAPFRAEYRVRAADGEYRWVIGHAVPRTEEDGSFVGLVGSCVDVTEEREAREILEVSRARRIESLGVLAGGIAHEFNNLLTVIGGRIQLLLDRFSSDETACHDLQLIQRSAQRAAALTQQLLAFGRRQLLQPRQIDLNEFVKELSLASVVGPRIELRLRLEEPLRRIHVDPAQLKRAILHLVEHACEAMPNGGRLEIETANTDLGEAFVQTHPGAAVGPHVRIAIRDSGAGLDQATQSRIFEPFFTAKRGVQGSGLSLPAVYGIVAQHGGYIEVTSERNRGTAFIVYLPAVATHGSATPGTSGRGPEGPRGTETVLLIERDKDVCLLLRDILEPYGYRVLEAADAKEAVTLVSRRTDAVHLVIASPDLATGTSELTERFRQWQPHIKWLYVGADAPGATSRTPPGLVYLQKPFTVQGLLSKVRQALDS